ncbi:MAG: hypothetical protein Q7T41_01380 [Candidatus Saccharibacteria bacterium]|nr:hypothetical protein [Candidatus Saccharibacteria bacterium]
MVELLPLVIPEELQAEALHNFKRYHLGELKPADMPALEYFTESVRSTSGNPNAKPRIRLSIASGTYNDPNTYIHRDQETHNVKYIATIASAIGAATVFIKSEEETDDLYFGPNALIETWVRRNPEGLYVKVPKSPVDVPWEFWQAQNSQIARFDMDTVYHAAAMLPANTQKILLSAIV